MLRPGFIRDLVFIIVFGEDSGGRTHIQQILSLLALPISLHPHVLIVCGQRGGIRTPGLPLPKRAV